MKYFRRSDNDVKVDAVQFMPTEQSINDIIDLVGKGKLGEIAVWYNHSFYNQPESMVWCSLRSYQAKGKKEGRDFSKIQYLKVTTQLGNINLFPGAWILKDTFGFLNVSRNDDFHELFASCESEDETLIYLDEPPEPFVHGKRLAACHCGNRTGKKVQVESSLISSSDLSKVQSVINEFLSLNEGWEQVGGLAIENIHVSFPVKFHAYVARYEYR